MMTESTLADDLLIRRKKVRDALVRAGMEGILLASDVNIYYMTGRIFNGYFFLSAEGEAQCFVRRPTDFTGEQVTFIRRPDDLTAYFKAQGRPLPRRLMLEADGLSYNDYTRLATLFSPAETGNASTLMRAVRMVKTPWELEQMRCSAERHAATYAEIPSCFRAGMTDLELQAEIERRMRLNGSIGLFRAYGPNMSIFMGSVLAGENAAASSPYDFALGGAGQTAICPIGANGTPLTDGTAILVDMAGNYTPYQTDMSRVFAVGRLPDKAYRAHQTALDIQAAVEATARAGTACAELYELACSMAEKAGLADCFMGTRQQAKFVGHGIGLEINEPPVLTPRSKEALEPDMVFAFEPKFVIEGSGAVGIENSFRVTTEGLEKLTRFEEQIISLT